MIQRFTKFLDYQSLEDGRTGKDGVASEKSIADLLGDEWKIASRYPIWGGLLLCLERKAASRP